MSYKIGLLQPWKLLDQHVAFETPWFTIKKQHMSTPAGAEVDYYIHDNHDSVICVCVNERNEVLIERQYRPPVQKVSIDYPSGRMEKDDKTTENAIRRELQEETGFEVTSLKKLSVVDRDPGFSTTRLHVFLAQGLLQGTPVPEETEYIAACFVHPSEILRMIVVGEMSCAFCHSATLLAFRERGWLNLLEFD
jgi:ADP-ribose pyrophosphatase